MWSMIKMINKRFRNRIVGKESPAILVCVFLLGAGGLIATADNASRIIAPFQIFQDPNGAFATLNLTGPTDTTTNLSFQTLASNGAPGATCLHPTNAWPATPRHFQPRSEAWIG